jgi:hypothetical protein
MKVVVSDKHVLPLSPTPSRPPRARELFRGKCEEEELMTKDEAEGLIRSLCQDWAKLRGVKPGQREVPSFSDFFSWLQKKYSDVLEFRSSISVRADVERWFDDELDQSWRN